MKKIFSILAAAVIAFSFTSCNEGSTVEMNGFKITVDSITETSAHIVVEPADTAAYYVLQLLTAEDCKTYNTDSVLADFNDYFANYDLELLAQYKYVYQGTIESSIDLSSNTEYTAFAFVIEKHDSVFVAPKGTAIKHFRTPAITPKETVAVNLAASFSYYPAEAEGENEMIQIISNDAEKNVTLVFTLEAPKVNGKLTEKNFFTYSSSVYNYVEWGDGDDDWAPLASLDLNGSFNADSTKYTFSGSTVGDNAVKYTFSNVEATSASAGTPARKAAPKKGLKVRDNLVK